MRTGCGACDDQETLTKEDARNQPLPQATAADPPPAQARVILITTVRGFRVSPRTYRIYCLNGSGRIAKGHWMQAKYDEELSSSLRKARQTLTGSCGKGDGS
jgi:hypothetical protein